MSRYNKFLLFVSAIIMAVSCGQYAGIDAEVSGASSDVVIKLLDINKFEVLDTVALDADGHFSYRMKALKGQPEFVYLFHRERKIASLVVNGGDRIVVKADTLGNYTVDGSQESVKLAQVEREYAETVARMNAIVAELDNASDADEVLRLRQQLGQEYVTYYRKAVRYVMENSRSISVVPVFYQTLGANLPVFSQSTDAIHFRNVADSLALVYPDSKYVKALAAEAERRFGHLQFETHLNSAKQIGYPEIDLPGIDGKKYKLTEVDAKVVMIHFWTASDANQKMFNLDYLKPVYEEFHDKGFEIYQVSLDVDKGLWAQVIKQQNLPWVSVCDSRGASSPFASAYNIKSLPATYIISGGELVDGAIVDNDSLRKLLRRLL